MRDGPAAAAAAPPPLTPAQGSLRWPAYGQHVCIGVAVQSVCVEHVWEGGREGGKDGGREGGKEGGKEGVEEGGKEGKKEGGKEGRREGGRE